MGSDRDAVMAAYDELDAAFDRVLGLSFDAITHCENIALQHRMERNLRRAPMVGHRLIAALAAGADPKALGGKNLADVLATALRISTKDAKRRINHAELLGPRTAMTGEALHRTGLPETQVHHVDGWVNNNGQTNINTLTLACGPDNRLVEEGGWTTRKRKDGRTEWVAPPHLDTGQSRVNNYHHPEKYLRPEEEDEDP